METNAAALRNMSAVLLGNTEAWRWDERAFDALCVRAEAHGVLPLVAEQLAARVPAVRRHSLDDRLRRRVAADLVRERELVRLLEAFHDAGVAVLVIKGAHLAFTLYPRPDLRPRVDSDLLVALDDVERADEVLRSLDYQPVPQVAADLVMYQRSYERRYVAGVAHTVDLHWRLSNPQRFGDALSHAELLGRARPIPALGTGALGPGTVDALLIACIHRIAHHLDAERLIWSYDIHLLAETLEPCEWQELIARARERQVALACHRGLASAREHFATSLPASLMEGLAVAARTERSMRAYLDGHSRHISRVVDDFRSAGSIRRALRMARQHMLPPPAYMREVYAPASSAPLPWLYARRVWGGARRWLSRS